MYSLPPVDRQILVIPIFSWALNVDIRVNPDGNVMLSLKTILNITIRESHEADDERRVDHQLTEKWTFPRVFLV